jgi:two-component system chemotaxis response regulator CheB
MANRDILAIGTSAGGFDALRFLASKLPRDLPASVLVVIHLASRFRSQLDLLLSKAGPLPARFAEDGDVLEQGRIYIGPPEHHLMVRDGRLQLGHGPRENFSRPAIDPLFRSAALCCGHRTVGVVLTGSLGDGASGLHALKQSGGITVVQDPTDAEFPEMPQRAIARSAPDHIESLSRLPELLTTLVQQQAGSPRRASATLAYETGVAQGGKGNMDDMDRIGRRSLLACPDCHGIMWEIEEGDLARYRCHLGHAYTAELMSIALDENLRQALGSALRSLEERIRLMEKLNAQANGRGEIRLAEVWSQRAQEYEREARVIRESIRRVDALAAHPVEGEAVGNVG